MTDPATMTKRQAEVLAFIAANSHVYGPTIREVMHAFGFTSPNGVVCHLKALERKGLIKRLANKARGIEVCHAS